MNVQLCYMNGEIQVISILSSEKIIDKKKSKLQENEVWKSSGKVLKDNKIFGDYDIRENDTIYTTAKNIGGANISF